MQQAQVVTHSGRYDISCIASGGVNCLTVIIVIITLLLFQRSPADQMPGRHSTSYDYIL